MDPSWVQQLLPPAASGKEDLSSRALKPPLKRLEEHIFLSANINTKKVSLTPVKIYHLDPLPLPECQDASRFK